MDAMEAEKEEHNARRLWCAVMMTAIQDAVGQPLGAYGRMHRKRVRESARSWIESDSTDFGSFVFCCQLIDVDPRKAREVIFNPSCVFKYSFNMPSSLGAALRAYRAMAQISQAALAKRLGAHPATLSKVELGRKGGPVCDSVAAKAQAFLQTHAPELCKSVSY
jgi:DNA-binding XRE family transcriptional regulator